MTDDMRVIFIKLADRLHNLQTLKFLAEPAQKRIAAETLEIYAPIANRLGMGRIKAELEDLAFRYVEPEEYFRMAALIEPRRKTAEAELRSCRRTLERLMKENRIPAEIVSRIKRPYSIWQQDEGRRRSTSTRSIDFLALRIITDSVKNCYAALGIIHQHWTHMPQRFRDFIAMPKPNLYQALHTTIITEDKLSFEIQIRTPGDARPGRERHRRPLAVQGRGRPEPGQGGQAPPVAAGDGRALQGAEESPGIPEEPQDQPHPGGGLRLHAQGPGRCPCPPAPRPSISPSASTPRSGFTPPGPGSTASPRRCKTLLRTGDIVEILTAPEREPGRGLAEHGLHLRRPPADQAPAQPAGQAAGRGPGPQALGKGNRPLSDLPADFPAGDDLARPAARDARDRSACARWMHFFALVGPRKDRPQPQVARAACRPAGPGAAAKAERRRPGRKSRSRTGAGSSSGWPNAAPRSRANRSSAT